MLRKSVHGELARRLGPHGVGYPGWWEDVLARDPDDLGEGEEPAPARAEGLRRFLEALGAAGHFWDYQPGPLDAACARGHDDQNGWHASAKRIAVTVGNADWAQQSRLLWRQEGTC